MRDKGAPCPQTAGCAGNESGRDPMDELEATEFFVGKLRDTKNNAEFFDSIRRRKAGSKLAGMRRPEIPNSLIVKPASLPYYSA